MDDESDLDDHIRSRQRFLDTRAKEADEARANLARRAAYEASPVGRGRAAALAVGTAAREANDLDGELIGAREDWALTADLPPAERHHAGGGFST